MAKAVKTPKTNAMRELESAGISYVLHTYEDDGDEPTTGLHFEDVRQLLDVLQRLVDAGNTVLVIEHNLDVIKVADRLIDMGPEGGNGGGTVVVSGTPEQVADCPQSYTGKFLAPLLRRDRERQAQLDAQ